MGQREQVKITLPVEQVAEMDRLRKITGASRSEYIQIALQASIADEQKEEREIAESVGNIGGRINAGLFESTGGE